MTIENATIMASRNQLASRLGEEVVILNLDDGQYYGLNALGAFVWERIDQPRSFGDLVDEIVGAYDVERSRCEADLKRLIEHLAEQKLIQIQAVGGDPAKDPASEG